MRLRRFEIKFTEQVAYTKIICTYNTVSLCAINENTNISKNRNDISHQCGYYDQMHAIKEFKEFAGSSPVSFYKKTPLPNENYRKQ